MKIGDTVYYLKWLEVGRDRLPVAVSEGIVTGFYFGTFVQADNKILIRRQDAYTIRKGAELEYQRQAKRFNTDYWKAVCRALTNIERS